MGQTYDVIVAGAGHNGLIAGAYLAKAGVKVCVVDQQEYVGGGVTTRELTIPGFKHDVCSIAHPAMQTNPMIRNDELELQSKYGLKYIVPDETITILYPDDKYLTFYRDVDTTCQNIAKYSEKDAEAYRKFASFALETLEFIKQGISMPPAPYGAAMSMMDQSPQGQELIRLFHLSPWDICNELFESPEMVLGLTRMRTEAMLAPKAYGSAMSLFVMLGIAHRYGYCLPEGGSGMLSESLLACLEDHGGEARTSSLIKKFKLSGNECQGVILDDGEEILAKKAVVTTLNVMQLPELVGEENLPEEYVTKSKRLKLSDYMAFHMELALDEYPKYKCGMTPREAWFVEYVHTYDYVQYLRAYDDLMYGDYNIREPLIMCPTTLDSTRTPEGKHTLYCYLFAPYDLKEGGPERWDDIKEETEEGLIETIRQHTTNMGAENILGRWSMTPLDYARYNPAWPKGDFAHFNATIMQSGGNRPFAGWNQYKTPVDRLYMCGPSTHPGWAVSGAARAGMWTIFEALGLDFEKMTK